MTGDGSFGMSVGELETITRLGLPIIVIQCSNGTFGWIKELQHLYHDDRYFGVDFNAVDYAAIARGFGFCAAQVTDPDDVELAVREAVETAGPFPRYRDRIASNGDATGRGLDRCGGEAAVRPESGIERAVPFVLDVDRGPGCARAGLCG